MLKFCVLVMQSFRFERCQTVFVKIYVFGDGTSDRFQIDHYQCTEISYCIRSRRLLTNDRLAAAVSYIY